MRSNSSNLDPMAIPIAEAMSQATQTLREAGVPEPRRDAGSLLSFVIRKDRTFLISHPDDLLLKEEINLFRATVVRRAMGEPLQYITGIQDFFGREFRVSPDVLIPRPETELLVEAALEVINEQTSLICDIGTGSGCIAVTLLCERAHVQAVAVDISVEALEIAKQNANAHSVSDRITFAVSDCFAELDPGVDQFDLVVSNPPYVSAGVVSGLQREVKDHEPLLALSPGQDGLIVIRRLIREAPAFVRGNGHLIMEIGFDQGEAVQRLVGDEPWKLIDIRPDLQGIPRIVVLEKK